MIKLRRIIKLRRMIKIKKNDKMMKKVRDIELKNCPEKHFRNLVV